MKTNAWRSGCVPLLMAGLLLVGAAHADDPRPAYGPGMMGGWGMGPGMMGGYGRGYGPGMMYDDDARQGWGYGHGMMGGWGMGPGMMGGGWGMGAGMMGLGPVWALELNDNQRRAIDKIMADQHRQQWAVMSALFAAQGKLRELQMAEQWDEKAITRAYDDIFKQQRAMIEASVRTRNQIYEQLSAEQKEQLRRWSWGGRWGR